MSWLVRRILRNALSNLFTPANMLALLSFVTVQLGKLPLVGDQIKNLLDGVDLTAVAEKLSVEILDFLLPLIPQTVGTVPAVMSVAEGEADAALAGDMAAIAAGLAARK